MPPFSLEKLSRENPGTPPKKDALQASFFDLRVKGTLGAF